MNGRRIVKKPLFPSFRYVWRLHLSLLGIYAVGDNEEQLPGQKLAAAENNIAEIHVHSGGEKRSIDVDSSSTVPLQSISTIGAVIC